MAIKSGKIGKLLLNYLCKKILKCILNFKSGFIKKKWKTIFYI